MSNLINFMPENYDPLSLATIDGVSPYNAYGALETTSKYSSPEITNLPAGTTTPKKFSFFDSFKSPDGSRLDFGAIGDALKGVTSVGSMIAAFQQNKLAKEQLQYAKDVFQTNLTNQLASYNTGITDRAYARSAQNNSGDAAAESYIAANRLGS